MACMVPGPSALVAAGHGEVWLMVRTKPPSASTRNNRNQRLQRVGFQIFSFFAGAIDQTPHEQSPRDFRFAGFVGPVLRQSGLGFLLRLRSSCFLLRRILSAGLAERPRVEFSAARPPVTLTHSLLPCSARSTATRLQCPRAARRSCQECG